MDALPTELLLAIIDRVTNEQSTLACCNRINRRWHALTRAALYRQPRLQRLPALLAFLTTIDSPDTQLYCPSSQKDRSTNSPTRLSALGYPSSSGTAGSRTSTESTERNPSSPTLSFLSSRSPPGALVITLDLSMLPHRWEDVHYGHVEIIVRGCPSLCTLDLSNCVRLRDNAVQLIAEHLGPRQLKSLVLSGCTKVSDLGILSLCAHATRIENLELAGCDRISDISVLELGSAVLYSPGDAGVSYKQTQGGSTELMDIGRTSTGTCLQGMSRSLRSLDLSHCTRITDTGIKGLRLGATQLSSLNLEGCYGVLVSDDGLGENEWEDLDEGEASGDSEVDFSGE